MTWYVAHALMVLRPQSPITQALYCWENLLLIEAATEEDPWEIATKRANDLDITEEFESRSVYPVPSRWEFVGIRKVVEVRHDTIDDKLTSGDELTYNTLLFENDSQMQTFLSGKECTVRYGKDNSIWQEQ